MPGFLPVLIMSTLLGAASFGIGVLPLSFTFSSTSLAKLSALGTGLLLGAALGVIIPEGIETLASGNPPEAEFPTSKLALSLLAGFTCMLVLEQFISPHSHLHAHAHAHSPQAPTPTPSKPPALADVEFDVELGELERMEGIDIDWDRSVGASKTPEHPDDAADAESAARAYPLTFGLVMHALADGLALGASALSTGGDAGEDRSVVPSGLSLVVFFALIVHKAPTVLALTTSLLATSLPRPKCRKHIAVFSAATPVGALLSYLLLTLLGASSEGHWPGIALLVSGGTFLYVATVIQPVSSHGSPSADELGTKMRTLLIVVGMLVPFAVGALLGHGHGH